MVGKTPCGRATVITLNLSRQRLVVARRGWAAVDWHAPVTE